MFSELTIAYLFLGGVGAGSLVFLSIAQLASTMRQTNEGWLRDVGGLDNAFYLRAYIATFVALLLGVLCLVFDLPNPEKAWLLFRYPNSSILSVGSVALALSMSMAALFAMVYGAGIGAATLMRHRRLWSIVSLLISGATALYPGILLMAMPSDHAWHSMLVPILFTLSALSTGIALLVLCFVGRNRNRGTALCIKRLVETDTMLIVVKVAATLAYVLIAAYVLRSLDQVNDLLFGHHAALFWLGYGVCGLAAPFVLECIARRRPTDVVLSCMAVLILIGGCCLRIAVVGLQS